ncbi:MAG: hypothetical protein WKG32_22110 [Gemmatimonadaceae bacterium]
MPGRLLGLTRALREVWAQVLHGPAVRAFAPAGLALGFLVAAATALPLRGERLEWAAYLTLGSVFPVALIALSAPTKRWQRWQDAAAVILGLMFVLACAATAAARFRGTAALFALVAAFAFAVRRASARQDQPAPARFLVGIAAVVFAAAWVAAERFVWWTPTAGWSAAALIACALVSAVAAEHLAGPLTGPVRMPRLVAHAGDAGALLFLALASVRADRLFSPDALHHWAFFTGAAQLVREGGWLLWDVPSQYGFLSTLALAAFPAGSVWQALYLINSLVLFLSAVFLYWLLRNLRPTFTGRAFALFATVSAVFLIPGNVYYRFGPQEYPSAGAMRFVWCYVLLAVLVWACRRDDAPARHAAILIVGNVAWLLGCLWSVESLAYSSAIWLPAFAVLAWRWTGAATAERRPRWRTRLEWALLPAGLAALMISAIELGYRTGLGHGPDWWAFVEYVVPYASGSFSSPIDRGGPVATLVLGFCGLAMVLRHAMTAALRPAALAPAFGAWATLWATASYYVGRSNPNYIAPLLCTAAAVALGLPTHSGDIRDPTALPRLLLVPAIAIIALSGIGQPEQLWTFAYGLREGFEPNLSRRLPRLEADVTRLFATAEVGPQDGIVVVSRYPLAEANDPSEPPSRTARPAIARAWLPAVPFAALTPIPEARRRTYVARFIDRTRAGGWLLVPRQTDTLVTDASWLYDQLSRTHDVTRQFETPTWRLLRYDFRRPAGDSRPNGHPIR